MSNSTHQNAANDATEMQLQLQSSGRSDQQIRIKSKKSTIGSHDNCTVVLNSNSVQPVHCMLIQGSAGTVIRNFHADTRLNGETVGDAWFQAGDTVSVGNIDLQNPVSNSPSGQPERQATGVDSNQATRELEERTQQVMDLIDRLGDLENELGQLKESSSRLDEKASAFEHQVNEKLNEVDRLERQNADLMSRLEFTRQDREMIQELEQKSAEIASRTVELESALEQKDSIIAQFASQNSTLAREVTELRTQPTQGAEDAPPETDEDNSASHEGDFPSSIESTPENDAESNLISENLARDQVVLEDASLNEECVIADDLENDPSVAGETMQLDETQAPNSLEPDDDAPSFDPENCNPESDNREADEVVAREETLEKLEPVDSCNNELESESTEFAFDGEHVINELGEENFSAEDFVEDSCDDSSESETIETEHEASSIEEVPSSECETNSPDEGLAGNPFAVLDMIDHARSNSFHQDETESQFSSGESESVGNETQESGISESGVSESDRSEITDFQSLLKQESTENTDSQEPSDVDVSGDDLASQWEAEFRNEFLRQNEEADDGSTDSGMTDEAQIRIVFNFLPVETENDVARFQAGFMSRRPNIYEVDLRAA